MNESPLHVVFGATGGIGRELANQLNLRGARLVLCSRSEDKLSALASQLSNAIALPCDATSAHSVDAVMEEIGRKFGRIDGVAHCVGSLLLKPAHLTLDAEWSAVIATNLTSAFNVLRASVQMMTKTKGGSIVLVSSAAAQHGIANHEAIAAAKAGVIGLARSAAATYARQGIRVNCVAPGLTRTPMTASLTSSQASLSASTAMHALGRIGLPSDVASAIAWLLDPAQSWVTAQVIAVDGGLSSIQPRPGTPAQPQPIHE
jgi:NAD(P)-dependent dehydrogenase (short-subunit alcohol dehydrogenase family)